MSDFLEWGLFNPEAPLAEAHTLPSSWYTEEEYYEWELEKVFSRTWQLAGRLDQISEPGYYIRTRLGTENALLLRDEKGELRALSNICRHKATEIIKDDHGKLPCLTCRYHGWTYHLDGRLRKAPQFEGAKSVENEFSLPSFATSNWGPYAFTSISVPHEPLENLFSEVNRTLGNYPIDKFQFIKRVTYDVKCNWKIFIDNYLDGGYHVPSLHKGLASVLDDDKYKIELFQNSVLQSAPLQKGRKEEVNEVRRGERALYWWVYPNLMLNFYDDIYDMNLVVPTGPESCQVIFDYFASDPSQKAWIEKSIEVAHQVQLEDVEVSESVQRGLRSQTYKHGRFSPKREAGGYLFHKLLAKDLSLGGPKK